MKRIIELPGMNQIDVLPGMLEISDVVRREPDVPPSVNKFIEAGDVNEIADFLVGIGNCRIVVLHMV